MRRAGAHRGARLAVVALLAVPSAAGCHGERDEARRAQAGSVVHATEKLRAAPNDGKRVFLKALEAVACSADDVCALKSTCVSAYSLQVNALDSLAAVRAAASNTADLPKETAALLSRAEEELRRASEQAKACADAEATARGRYVL